MMISILQRFLISKTHPEISVDELIQLSNFRKSWMRASFTATWDHSPQHGTKMTLEPRCDVQMVGVCFPVTFVTQNWWKWCLRRPLEEHCLERTGEDDGLWLLFCFHVLWMLQRLQSWCLAFFFSKKKGELHKTNLWISFYDPCGGRLALASCHESLPFKKKLQLATTGKMHCLWLASQRKSCRLSLGFVFLNSKWFAYKHSKVTHISYVFFLNG